MTSTDLLCELLMGSGSNPGMNKTVSRHMVDMAQCFIKQRRDVRVEEAIHDLATISIADDKTKVS